MCVLTYLQMHAYISSLFSYANSTSFLLLCFIKLNSLILYYSFTLSALSIFIYFYINSSIKLLCSSSFYSFCFFHYIFFITFIFFFYDSSHTLSSFYLFITTLFMCIISHLLFLSSCTYLHLFILCNYIYIYIYVCVCV